MNAHCFFCGSPIPIPLLEESQTVKDVCSCGALVTVKGIQGGIHLETRQREVIPKTEEAVPCRRE